MPETTYDRDALLRAYLDHRRYSTAAEPLREHHRRRHEAFAAAFDADLTEQRRHHLDGLFRSTIATLERLRSPFDAYLEAPPAVVAMWQQHGGEVQRGLVAAGAPLHRLALDCVGVIWGIGADARVTADDLRRHGHYPAAPAPNPDDFW